MKYKFIALCMMLGLIASASFAQTIKVTGTVSGKADGQPLIGAGVVVVGTSTGTSTDSRGAFELTVPAGSQLEVSYIGYTSVIVDAAANLFIELEEDLDFLEEVIVTGYMTERKADLTGSVAVVKMKEVADIPTGNVLTALKGRVAGLTITSDGTPGGAREFFPYPRHHHH